MTLTRVSQSETFQELFYTVADDNCILPDNLYMFYRNKQIYRTGTPKGLNIWGEAEIVACDQPTHEYLKKQQTLSYLSSQVRPEPPSTSTGATSSHILDIDLDEDNNAVPYAAPLTHTQPDTSTGYDSQAESESGESQNTFKISLRSGMTGDKQITVTVRPTTKCGAIVRAFILKAKLDDSLYPSVMGPGGVTKALPSAKGQGKKGKGKAVAATNATKDPKLSLDGDSIPNDTPIGDMDVEDGDLLDVVGL
jgi:hypothetical protein